MRRAPRKSAALIADGHSEQEAEELVDSVDRERIAYVKHYFNADWPTRSLYHLMLNTAVGNEPVVEDDSGYDASGRGQSQSYRLRAVRTRSPCRRSNH